MARNSRYNDWFQRERFEQRDVRHARRANVLHSKVQERVRSRRRRRRGRGGDRDIGGRGAQILYSWATQYVNAALRAKCQAVITQRTSDEGLLKLVSKPPTPNEPKGRKVLMSKAVT